MKVPEGGLACPSWSTPQQTIDPLLRNPQECPLPTEIWVKVPEGAVASPLRFEPQQTIDPSLRKPHECQSPADTSTKVAPAVAAELVGLAVTSGVAVLPTTESSTTGAPEVDETGSAPT